MEITGLLNNLIFPALLAFGLYVIKRFDRMQAEVKKTTDAVEVDLRKMLEKREEDVKYFHENFADKGALLRMSGETKDILSGIYSRMNDIKESLDRHIGEGQQ